MSKQVYQLRFFCLIFGLFLFLPLPSGAVNSLDVVISEIAWMGTKANSSDEWIELYNNTNQAISLEGWGLYEAGGETLIEPLTGIIEVNSYYLIERTDDTTISDIPASQEPSGWGGYGLNNNGERLRLRDNSSVAIDEVDCSGGWFAGETSPDYKTMERKDSTISGNESNNWGTNNGVIVNGRDAKGNPISGTPKAKNSMGSELIPLLTSTPAPTSPAPSPEISPVTTPSLETPSPILSPSPSPTLMPFPTPEISYPAGIIINEILPSPTGSDETEEWIEILNKNSSEVDLSFWQISDTAGKVTIYTFPEGTKISTQGFLVLPRPTTKIVLNNDGDVITLLWPNGEIADKVIYEKVLQGKSFNKTDSGWVWSDSPTPGTINIVPTAPDNQLESESDKTNLNAKIPGNQSIKREENLATISKEIPEKNFFVFPLTALTIAIFSGFAILFLKKKIKR